MRTTSGQFQADTRFDSFIKKNYRTMSDTQMAAKLKQPYYKIRNRRRLALGLVKDHSAWRLAHLQGIRNYATKK